MIAETRELLDRLKAQHDALARQESTSRTQRQILREACTALRLGEAPAVVAAQLERDGCRAAVLGVLHRG